MEIFELAGKSIVDMDGAKAAEIAGKGLAEGIPPYDLMTKGFIPGIVKVGELFERGKIFLPELVRSSEAMEKVSGLMNASLSAGNAVKVGTAVIGTVKGDVHDIGKSIVVSLFQANGLAVCDLGRDVPTHKFIEKALEINADIIGTSALLTTTMQGQKELEDLLRKEGLREKFITVVGGAPITERWARRIGADAYAENAIDGVNKVLSLLEQRKSK
ncbi:cobalamin B12-binding domain-containing protein [Candidatus Formimonas warabiya]|uniref:Dimethylamine corrinoid protein 3 n=1 Tax=Formimonas warabiya TaxID=1761012 RepID=A0A3G1KYS0_FORW1|nr:corrinoid protein [Candidatus Formimonas warabiya]ATW27646.1 dimethylamine corrinoid protein 3 [Candidatus Formimonas warabiya]